MEKKEKKNVSSDYQAPTKKTEFMKSLYSAPCRTVGLVGLLARQKKKKKQALTYATAVIKQQKPISPSMNKQPIRGSSGRIKNLESLY